jgi:hypothetical protein
MWKREVRVKVMKREERAQANWNLEKQTNEKERK